MSISYPIGPQGETVALLAIGWIVADASRAERFFSLTGLDPDQLRARIDDATALGAALDFLLSHEPDLLACADAIGVTPASIAAARDAIA